MGRNQLRLNWRRTANDSLSERGHVQVPLTPGGSDEVVSDRGAVNTGPRRSRIGREVSAEARGQNYIWRASRGLQIEHYPISEETRRVVERILAFELFVLRKQQVRPRAGRLRLDKSVGQRKRLPAIGALVHQDVVRGWIVIR